MKVVSIGSDRKIFDINTDAHKRAFSQGSLFDELHLIIFSKKSDKLEVVKIADNIWLHPTNSKSRWHYIFDAVRIGDRVISDIRENQGGLKGTVITCQDPFETGYVGSKLSRIFNIPLHLQIHTDMFSPFFARVSFLNRIRLYMAGKIIPQASAVRVVSHRIKDSLVDKYGKNTEDKISVLPVYTDMKEFLNKPIDTNLAKKYSQFDFIILMICRFEKEKNIPLAFKILAKVLKRYPKTGMVIVGSGSLEKSLKNLSKEMGINKNVIFENWVNNPFSYYKTANLHLITSSFEGYGLTIAESLLSGTPVVSTDVGIAPRFLKSDQYSFVCPVGDLPCLSDKVSALVANQALGARLIVDTAKSLRENLLSREQYLIMYKKTIEKALGLDSKLS